MARLTILTTAFALLTPFATAAPFAAQEQCTCIPIGPGAPSNSSAAKCSEIAAQLQATRYQMRLMPYLSDLWVASGEVAHVKIPSNPPAARLRHSMETLDLPVARRRGGGRRESARTPSTPCRGAEGRRRNTGGAAGRRAESEQRGETRRQTSADEPLQRMHEDAFNIVCRTRGSPEERKQGIVFGVRPVPVVFILLAMVLACTTIIDWVVDAYQAYSARVRLEGDEKRIYALVVESGVGEKGGHEGEGEGEEA